MKGYLIYHREEAVRNQAFIKRFKEEGKRAGITFEYISHEKYQKEPLPDFVLNRTRDALVSKWYEKRNVTVFHSALITEIGNHKMKTLEYLKKKLPIGIREKQWAPESYFVPKEQIQKWENRVLDKDYNIFQEIPLFGQKRPCVLKTVHGHGGTEVAEFPENEEDFLPFLKNFDGKDCILQEKILSDSRDVRVYVLGNQIYQAICRQGKNDFRSNFSLGGTASVYELSHAEKEWVLEFVRAFEQETLGLAGLDFIITRSGRLVFNELEEMVGCRMLYQYTRYNVVKDYVFWIQKFVENNCCQ